MPPPGAPCYRAPVRRLVGHALFALALPTLSLGPLAAGGVAYAAEGTELASALEPGDPFDLFFTVDYNYDVTSAAIKREYAGLPGTSPDGAMPIVKDLVFERNRHIITPRVQLGIFQGLQLSAAMPIVLSDGRSYSFDQRADPCIFGSDPQARQPTCIDRDNSSTIRDAILPRAGYDASDPLTGFSDTSKEIFRGVTRSGTDQLHLGLAWAALDQAHDDTKPTWVLGGEARLSIGDIMRFNRFSPDSDAGVSRGLHEVRAYTSLSKRTTWAEPFVTFWWQTPYAIRSEDPDEPQGSLFWDVGFGQNNRLPQQQAGTTFGFEAIPWENPVEDQRLAVEVRGRLEAHFEGRGYSEMWELFAYAGDAQDNATGPLVLDRDPLVAGRQVLSHPGVTDIENYMTFAGRLGLRGRLGKYARFAASFELAHDQQHRISWTDAGTEFPACSATVTVNCESMNDEVISPGTREVNPLHSQTIDAVGRRYLVDESTTYTFFLTGAVLF